MLQLLGSQKLRNSAPSEENKFAGNAEDYAKFEVKYRSEVSSIVGISDEERFLALQERVKGEALEIVEDHVYLPDKSLALEKALAALKFYYGKKSGSAQANLDKLLNGKETSPNSIEAVKELLREVESMAVKARAMKEESFLELDATVISIVRKRFGGNMKRKFAQASQKAEGKGEKVNVDFVISFLQDWYSSLNHKFGMVFLLY